MTMKLLSNLVLAVSFCVFSLPLAAKDKLPETTKDGLKLQHDTKLAAVYMKPGANLEDYDKFFITDVYVAFKKNWQRNYNEDVMGLEGRVTDKDIEIIKTRVAKEFKTVFTRVLEKRGYEFSKTSAKDVLILKPAITNLVVNAPDTQQAAIARTFVASAGEATLYMELHDSLTSDKIAEVMDAQAAGDDGIAHMANRVANKQEFDRVLDKWANILASHLEQVKGPAKSGK
jgi:hypothetical protein